MEEPQREVAPRVEEEVRPAVEEEVVAEDSSQAVEEVVEGTPLSWEEEGGSWVQQDRPGEEAEGETTYCHLQCH